MSGNINRTKCFPFDEIEFGKCTFRLLFIRICMNIYFHFLVLIINASIFPLFLYLFLSALSLKNLVFNFFIINCKAKQGMDRIHIFCYFSVILDFTILKVQNLSYYFDFESRLVIIYDFVN